MAPQAGGIPFVEHVMLIRITSKSFCAGLVAESGIVVRAAPIISYMMGWRVIDCVRYCKSRGLSVQVNARV